MRSLLTSMQQLGVAFPLRVSTEDTGVILDADDFDVVTVDVNGTLSDEAANEIARAIAVALNVVVTLASVPQLAEVA